MKGNFKISVFAAMSAMAFLPTLSAEDAKLTRMDVPKMKVLGPFGHPDFINKPGNSDAAGWFVCERMWKTEYPADKEFDLAKTYQGDLTRDDKGKEKKLKWDDRTAIRGIVSTKDVPSDNLGVAFFVVWVKSPKDMLVKMSFPAFESRKDGDIQKFGATQHVWVNDILVEMEQYYLGNPYSWHPKNAKEGQEVLLKEGWNMIYARVQSVFAGTKFACEIELPREMVRQLEFRTDPPMEKGQKFALGSQIVPTMAGAPTQGEINAQKEAERNGLMAGNDGCGIAAPEEAGTDAPLDTLGANTQISK